MEKEQVMEILKRCKVFRSLSEEEQNVLAETAETKQFLADETIFAKGEHPASTFCLLISGAVKILDPRGEERHRLTAAEIVGEIGPISPLHQRTCDVVAAEPTQVLQWEMEDIVTRIPGLEKELKELAWQRIVDTEMQ